MIPPNILAIAPIPSNNGFFFAIGDFERLSAAMLAPNVPLLTANKAPAYFFSQDFFDKMRSLYEKLLTLTYLPLSL